MAYLEHPSGELPPIPLGERVVLGRSEGFADAVIDDKRLSRKHAQVRLEGGRFIVSDLGSRNGTKLNGAPVANTAMKDGDELSLGGCVLRFREGDPPGESESQEDRPAGRESGMLAPGAPVPSLKLVKGTLNTVLVRLDRFPFTVGRKTGADLVLTDDINASGRHSRFDRDEAGVVSVQDLNSTNGTKVNGMRVDAAELKDGDRVQIGSQLFRFVAARDAAGAVEEPDELSLDAAGDSGPVPEPAGAPAVSNVKAAGATASKSAETAAMAIGDAGNIEDAEVNTRGVRARAIVVRGLEFVAALVVVAAIVAFIVFAKRDGPQVSGGTKTRATPVGDGGLLKNHSFEAEDAESDGSARDWSPLEAASTDEAGGAALPGTGGAQVLRIKRFAASHARTLWVNRNRLSLPAGGGLTLSSDMRMPEGGGTGFLFVEWFATEDDSVPLQNVCRGFAAGHKDWTRVSARFAPPAGAGAARIGVGMTGREGVVLFDEVRAERTDIPPEAGAALSAGRLQLMLRPTGEFDLALATQPRALPILTGGRLLGTSSSGAGAGLPIHDWLVESPRVAPGAGDSAAALVFTIFDPEAESVRDVRLELRPEGLRATLEASPLSGLPGLTLRATGTTDLMGEEAVVLDRGRVIHFGRSILTTVAADVRFTGTRDSRRLSTPARMAIEGNSLELFGASGEVDLLVDVTDRTQRYAELLKRLQGAEGELVTTASDPERMNAALDLMASYAFDRDAIEAGARAALSMAAYYRVKQIELGEVVRRGPSAGSEELYLDACERSSELSDELTRWLPQWNVWTAPGSVLSALDNSNALPAWAASRIDAVFEGLSELEATAQRLKETEALGRDRAFLIRVRRDELRAAPLLASAQDHLAAAEYEQAKLKFVGIIRNYPLGQNATLARRALLQVARQLAGERARRMAEGLDRIARERQQEAAALLDNDIVKQSHDDEFFRRIEGLRADGVDVGYWRKMEQEIKSEAQALLLRLESQGS